MKFDKIYDGIISVAAAIVITGLLMMATGSSCNGPKKEVNHIDSVEFKVPVLDSNDNGDISKSLVYDISETLSNTKDSLDKTKDSLRILTNRVVALNYAKDSITKVYKVNKEQLGVAQYKLLRIKYYNDVAAKGNNIKFLRGWIIRTLK